jgi:hypothetical protein
VVIEFEMIPVEKLNVLHEIKLGKTGFDKQLFVCLLVELRSWKYYIVEAAFECPVLLSL